MLGIAVSLILLPSAASASLTVDGARQQADMVFHSLRSFSDSCHYNATPSHDTKLQLIINNAKKGANLAYYTSFNKKSGVSAWQKDGLLDLSEGIILASLDRCEYLSEVIEMYDLGLTPQSYNGDQVSSYAYAAALAYNELSLNNIDHSSGPNPNLYLEDMSFDENGYYTSIVDEKYPSDTQTYARAEKMLIKQAPKWASNMAQVVVKPEFDAAEQNFYALLLRAISSGPETTLTKALVDDMFEIALYVRGMETPASNDDNIIIEKLGNQPSVFWMKNAEKVFLATKKHNKLKTLQAKADQVIDDIINKYTPGSNYEQFVLNALNLPQ